jgi:hypothetical protein
MGDLAPVVVVWVASSASAVLALSCRRSYREPGARDARPERSAAQTNAQTVTLPDRQRSMAASVCDRGRRTRSVLQRECFV